MNIYRTREEIPSLGISLPRPVESLHQIELTSRCSLRCVYCPSPQMVKDDTQSRPATDMPRETFTRAMEHVAYYAKRGTQTVLNLAGIGESMMRDDFIELLELGRVCLARAAAPQIPFCLATNGLHMTEERAKRMAELACGVWVSLHRQEKAGPAIELARRHGILVGTSNDPATNADDWAGQVRWFRSQQYVSPCQWIREGKAMVMAHGSITACCLDSTGQGAIGHVDDPVGSLLTHPYSLCRGCQQEIRVTGYEQR